MAPPPTSPPPPPPPLPPPPPSTPTPGPFILTGFQTTSWFLVVVFCFVFPASSCAFRKKLEIMVLEKPTLQAAGEGAVRQFYFTE